ncbi:MAG: apolipoprotein N-acyltransferase [Acidobacteriota bacterium]|nr:apolipoprotein N-acyltransferase [Acidobacteriota bacterium]
MHETVSIDGATRARAGLKLLSTRARAALPTLAESASAIASALLLLFAFPDFGAWPLAWVALTPLLYRIARRPRAPQSFLSGLLMGTLFFYTSCHWLTFPMIRYAEIPAWRAHILLLPLALAGGFFPALFALALSRLCARWGASALLLAPPVWAACEWARLGVIGQLWNAVGYSQAFTPALIQAARFGGVYAVSFLVLAFNAALAYVLLKRTPRSALASLAVVVCVALLILAFDRTRAPQTLSGTAAVVVAVQPNVIPDFNRSESEYDALKRRHFELSERALDALDESGAVGSATASTAQGNATGEVNSVGVSPPPRVVVWPESPMNFSFDRSRSFREEAMRFVSERRASLLFNSLEPVAGGGGYNAAVLINEKGLLAAQYDKIRLMPFGEYVPLPRWMPGADSLRGVVGDFTPGERYNLIPLGEGKNRPRAGVFICLESAYPYITRRLTREGADVLIEITNDAYQGDTAVLRQHLSNAVFRAVETGRTLLRVTNTGVSARITPRGEVSDETGRFQEAVRTWPVARSDGGETFYARFGDSFVAACACLSLFALALTAKRRRQL